MTIFYSAKTPGFFSDENEAPIPADAVQITEEEQAALLEGQTKGGRIVPDSKGFPVLAAGLAPTAEALEAVERIWRDAQLLPTDALVSRHRDEIEDGGATSITTEQYAELQAYRRQLRDWPQGEEFPLAEHRPTAPTWLTEQTT